VSLTVDPALDTDPDPATPAPQDEPERVFLLDLPESLIGRRDDRRDIRPEIPVRDPGVSRRHAKLLRRPDGGIDLLDLASANGTRLNGVEIEAGAPRTINDGDVVTMGRWSRFVLRGRS
jgi:pSer/pThr/pTyr-binding forkhead associated (FHA) protein